MKKHNQQLETKLLRFENDNKMQALMISSL